VILEEIMSAEDDPTGFVHDLLMAAMFEGDDLGNPILGNPGSIDDMTRDAIAAFHREHYVPGNVVVAAAGAVDHDAIVGHIASTVEGMARGATVLRGNPPMTLMTHEHCEREGEQSHVVFAYPGLDRSSDDRYALELVVHALGGGLSSRLFQEVRERRGLAYNVFASRAAYEHAGLVSLYAATASEHVRELCDVFHDQTADVAAKGIDERELRIAKGGIRASILLGLEDSGARMARLGRSQLVHRRVSSVDEIVAAFDAVTADDAARVAAQTFGGERTSVVLGADS
jgi:predicted Zn-dependent peptidase